MANRQDLVTYHNDRAIVSFHSGQDRAWSSEARFIFVLAGTQGGKTTFLPWWLWREFSRTKSPSGSNDYLAVTATYDLFKLKFLPEMRKVFENILGIGRFWAGERVIELSDDEGNFWANKSTDPMFGRIILRSVQSEGGLESATIKACIMDECGLDEFRLYHWEAIQRRLSLAQGRAMGATTIYNRGWLKAQVYDLWRQGNSTYDIIQFASYINPSFPREEYDRMAAILPQWKLNMFYKGEFDVPEGLIYDSFNEDLCIIDPFEIPMEWPRWGGLDFGGVNTAGLVYAENPDTGVLYLIDEYLAGGKTSKAHAKDLKEWNCKLWVGGSKSEGQWRTEFTAAGLPIVEPNISDVEVGISRVYAQHAMNKIMVFGTCTKYLDEKGTYAREIDRDGQVTEKIKDKNTFHLMDAERYIISRIRPIALPGEPGMPQQKSKWREKPEPEGRSKWKRY